MTEWLHFHFSLSCIGEGNGNPLQCSCLENPRHRGTWWAAVSGVTQSWTRLKRLSSSSSSSIWLIFSQWLQEEAGLEGMQRRGRLKKHKIWDIQEGGVFPGGSAVKNPLHCRRREFDAWVGKIPRRRKWQTTQDSFLENPMDRGAWWAAVYGVTQSLTRLKQLSSSSSSSFDHVSSLLKPTSHFLLAAKSLQSCPTLGNPIDRSPPGSPAPGILQARTLEWVAISFSNA